MKTHIPMVIGNWKMNPATVTEARTLFLSIRKGLGRAIRQTHVMIAAPFLFIADIQKLTPPDTIILAAQTVSPQSVGAHTGDIAIPMLQSVGVKSVILGHSERRAAGESDATIAAALHAVLKNGLLPIVCVGEQTRDGQGDYFTFIQAQLRSVLTGVPKNKLSQLVIAYEPIWAIGTGKQATPEDVREMKLFIQKVIADLFGRSAIPKVRIIYGGSVKPDNAAALLEIGAIDGFLVGGASLDAKSFIEIVNLCEAYAKSTR